LAPPDPPDIHVVTRSQAKNAAPKPHELLQSDEQVEQIVAKPYILQQSTQNDIPSDPINVSISFPINKSKPIIPKLVDSINHIEQDSAVLHAYSDPFDGSSSAYIQTEIFGIPVRAVLDTGAPLVILSSKFIKRIKFQPDISYDRLFGTAGDHKVTAQGAYSSIPIKLGSLVVTTPAIVL